MIRFSVTDNGIRVKKSLISSVEIPFEEISKIHIASGDSSVTTKDGTEYISRSVGVITHSYPQIYDHIVKYNIDFTDDYEKTGIGKVYTHDEVLEMVSKTTSVAQETADRVLREKLGNEYSAHLRVEENNEDAIMFFSLAKNGGTVKIPRELNNGQNDSEETAFDDMVLFFLTEWQSETRSGRYGVTFELTDADQCRKTVEDFVDYFCETYLAKSKNSVTLL
ncbi:MAG: hypothetical protein J6Y58_08220 [Clostridiales bacterium]|nr:hypothetical protein [Clostridiales bacterium]